MIGIQWPTWEDQQKRRAELAKRREEAEQKQAEADLLEYALIREKKSRLSARERDAVLRRVAARLGVEVPDA